MRVDKNLKILIGATVVLLISIVGFGVWLKNGIISKPIVQQNISATTTTVSQVSDWKTYHNEQVGIEFRYPPTWEVNQDTSSASGVNLDNFHHQYGHGGFVPYGSSGIYISKWLLATTTEAKILANDAKGQEIVSTSSIIVDGDRGTKVLFADDYGSFVERPTEVFVKHDNVWYKFFLEDPANIFAGGFDTLLSTVKFIDVVPDVSQWKTYRNEKYGFQLILSDGYQGYTTKEEEYTGVNEARNIYFSVPVSDLGWHESFSVFAISVFDLVWWNENTEFDKSNGEVFQKGQEHDFSWSYGQYLGKNSKYAFTGGASQDCPPSRCDLRLHAEDLYEYISDI